MDISSNALTCRGAAKVSRCDRHLDMAVATRYPVATRQAGWQRHRLGICTGLLAALLAMPAVAKEYVQRLSQMGHAVWRTQDGNFGSPNAVVRTRDGYLWIGTTNGLVRFDGARFVRWNQFGDASIAAWNIESMAASSDGSLWIGTPQHVARIRGGQIVDHAVPGRPLRIIEDHAGTVWIAQTRVKNNDGPVCSLRDGQVRCFGAPELPLRFAQDIVTISGGGFWVGSSEGLCRWVPSRPADCFLQPLLKPFLGTMGVTALLTARDGTGWVGLGRSGPGLGLGRLVNGEWQSFQAPAFDGSQLVVSSMLEDRAGGIWVGTEDTGLYRIRGETVEHFGLLDGLSSNTVNDLYEDGEGSVWAVTPNGLHQFRATPVSRVSVAEGLPRDGNAPVLPVANGDVWIEKSQVTGLSEGWMRVLPEPAAFRDRRSTALMEDHRKRLWIGLDRTLNVYENGKLTPVTGEAGTDIGVVARLVEDVGHDVWAMTFDRNRRIHRIRGLAVIETIEAEKLGLPQEVAPDPYDGVWLGYPNGDLASYRNGSLALFPADQVSRGSIEDLLVDPDRTVLAATTAGVLIQRNGARRRLGLQAGLPCENVTALIRDSNNALWLNAECGFIEVVATEIERWLAAPDSSIAYRLLDATSGAQFGASTFSPRAGRAQDGRVWFATQRFALMIDAGIARVKAAAPPVLIEDVRADRTVHEPKAGLRLPALTRDLEIRYTALSLVAPSKIRFQYLLEGRDTAWRDAETRRQAFYNDLPPGHYRFRVKAANGEGVWNDAGATIDFELPPAYYQTRWFIALCGAAAAGALYGLYLFRLRQMSTRLRERLAARTSERERIARDLHDTLLQSTQSLILRFQAAARDLPAGDAVRGGIERVLDSANKVMAEGRDRVLNLRAPGLDDLPQAFASAGHELAQRETVDFRVLVEGTERPIRHGVHEEAYQIGREAVFNASRHARPQSIEVHLIYNDLDFRMRVRDDGDGIDQSTLEAGSKADHWGLPGMRERAQKLGGSLEIWSRPGAGTEIELRVPAAVAYTRESTGPLGWRERIRALMAPP